MKSIWSVKYIHIIAIEFLLQMGLNTVNPVIAGYTIALGATAALGGLVTGVNSTVALVCRPFSGFFSDLLNKKTLLCISAILFFIGSFGMYVATSPIILGFFRALQGIAFALKSAILATFIPKVVPKERIGIAIGWMGMCSTLALAIGPSIGSFLCDSFGYPSTFLVSAVLLLCGVILVFSLDSDLESKDGKKSKAKLELNPSSFIYKPCVPISIVGALSGIPYAISGSMLLLAGADRGIDGVASFFAFYAAAAFLSKPMAGGISDKYGLKTVAMPCMVLEFVAVVVLVLMSSMFMAAVAGLLMGFGQGAAYSALQTESLRDVPTECMGRASNTFYIFPDVNMGFTPIIAGFVFGSFGVASMYAYGAMGVLIGIVVLLVFIPTHKRS